MADVLAPIRTVLTRAITPGDYATFLIAASLGYGAELICNVSQELTPGTAGVLAASFALGVKQSWSTAPSRRQAIARARRLREELVSHQSDSPAFEKLLHNIDAEIGLCDKRISTAKELEEAIKLSVIQYRTIIATPETPRQTRSRSGPNNKAPIPQPSKLADRTS